jgi:hypothetical protein
VRSVKRSAIKRKAWMKRGGSALKRGKPMKRGKRIKPRNPERCAKAEAEDFGAPARVARCLDCCVWTCKARAPSDAAHYRSRGAGGKSHQLVPLCRPHHREQEASLRKFEAKHRFKIPHMGSVVLCETLEEVASYVADLVRDHVCTDTPVGKRPVRCYVCRRALSRSELEDLTP